MARRDERSRVSNAVCSRKGEGIRERGGDQRYVSTHASLRLTLHPLAMFRQRSRRRVPNTLRARQRIVAYAVQARVPMRQSLAWFNTSSAKDSARPRVAPLRRALAAARFLQRANAATSYLVMQTTRPAPKVSVFGRRVFRPLRATPSMSLRCAPNRER